MDKNVILKSSLNQIWSKPYVEAYTQTDFPHKNV